MPASDARGIRQWGLSGWQALERSFDALFGSALNPLRHLGAIGCLAFAMAAASGVLLYIFFDTSVAGAWRSVESLAHWPLGLGRLLRGLHRYAADLLALAVLLHLAREWLHGHERGARRFHWLTGVPLVVFCFASAIGGFWLAWDQLGQYSAESTAAWLDALPMQATPLARNFLTSAAVSDRFFSLLIFVHVGVPLLLLFGLWFHLQRLSYARVLPPPRLALALVGTLALLALAQPVLSHAPAVLDRVPEVLRLDWLLLWLHPLTDVTSPALTWALALGGLAVLAALPWLPQPPRPAVAVVDADNCSGCELCFIDCPYAAVTMLPHPARRAGHLLAQVDADLCVGCGICAGSCPSSTPFRMGEPLVTGIDMPQLPVDAMRRRLRADLAASPAPRPLVVFACQHGAGASALAGEDVSVQPLLCAGHLPPSFVDYALRLGAAGVLVAACPESGCEFRLGEQWTRQRFARARRPHLRARLGAEPVALALAGPGSEITLAKALLSLRLQVQGQAPPARIHGDDLTH